MSRKAKRLLEKARRTKAGWMPGDLIALYEGFGFIIREGRGSHKFVSHPQHPKLSATFPDSGKELPKAYISKALRNIEAVLKETGSDD